MNHAGAALPALVGDRNRFICGCAGLVWGTWMCSLPVMAAGLCERGAGSRGA
jgi:hypothetical protein